ncbi:hypothetical protein Salat_2826700 [Sesamum alatum]|uniref:Uncharacterized protein n=1 Tax=Sesamum alatum TaxID=300844 RepID=A0AAE2C9J9_9LAMI|nr:hypothetical protein Salat_2826700 [Sesamum alatum]
MSYFSDQHHQEMQLFSHAPPSSSAQAPPWPSSAGPYDSSIDHLSLDLRLSISVSTPIKPPSERALLRKVRDRNTADALKSEAAEQIRLATIEKAYAERVMEMTRREMELAQSEFARARSLWERAREEVERAERVKERAVDTTDPTCVEITCLSCRQKFRP